MIRLTLLAVVCLAPPDGPSGTPAAEIDLRADEGIGRVTTPGSR